MHLGPAYPLVLTSYPERDPKKPDPRIGIRNAFRNQRNFGAHFAAVHHQKLNPIADCANRADKIMADPGAEQSDKIKCIRHGIWVLQVAEKL